MSCDMLTLEQFVALAEEEPPLEFADGDESVLAIRSNGKVSALHGGDRIDVSEVLPGFELTVEQLFACLR